MLDNPYNARWATYNMVQQPDGSEIEYSVPEITFPEMLNDYQEQPEYQESEYYEYPEEYAVAQEESKKKSKKHYDHTISFKQLCDKLGIKVRVTSEFRPGSKTKSGHYSNHALKDQWGNSRAIDVVPVNGDFEDLKNRLLHSEEARNWFAKRGYGIINEMIPQVNRKTGATGNHFHIGPDSWGRRVWNQWLANSNLKANTFIS